ncbi:MAG: hypothetical protein CM1200mP4_1340 [Rhodospirillaceae bacterium]|nr:MAG: hypothetical protein CM1200mP4_1340 [Rhodospirillaceae bacterium]
MFSPEVGKLKIILRFYLRKMGWKKINPRGEGLYPDQSPTNESGQSIKVVQIPIGVTLRDSEGSSEWNRLTFSLEIHPLLEI